jgi:hypothetical protein
MKKCESRWLCYLDMILLIIGYGGNNIMLAIQKSFGDKELKQKKVVRTIGILNDSWFWSCCHILRITGVIIFKPAMKFFESNQGIVAHNVYKIQKLLIKCQNLQDNIIEYFAAALVDFKEDKRHIIENHINSIMTSLKMRYSAWNHLPLL